MGFIRKIKASDLKAAGSVLDAAREGIVAIERRSESFVLMRLSEFERRIADAADTTPKSLEDLLVGYDKEAGRALLADWMADPARGTELL